MARQLSNKDLEISNLYEQIDRNASNDELQAMLRKENDAFRQENRLLRDKIGQLTFDLDNQGKHTRDESQRQINSLEQEVQHLRQTLNDREREARRLQDQVDDKDHGTQKQKNEWAEIYGNMKNEIEDLK